MTDLRPMLAAKADLDKLEFPLICQPKYDGFRCIIGLNGEGLSRTLKRLPNLHIQGQLAKLNETVRGGILGLDGEIVTYANGKMDTLDQVQSRVSARQGQPEFVFHVFDDYTLKNIPYISRHRMILERLAPYTGPYAVVVNFTAYSMDEALTYEERLVSLGFEGMIGRKPTSFYKYGRATVNEGWLLKFKRFEDAEAKIIGYEELERNENEATTNELGLTKRSSHKAGKVLADTLGALILDWNGIEFKVGTGFDEAQRDAIWQDRDDFMGRTVTFKYKGVGPNGKPLIASFKAFRASYDIGEPEGATSLVKGDLFDV